MSTTCKRREQPLGSFSCSTRLEMVRMKVETILSQIELGAIALPEFQRGYVWNRDQVRGLMDSLYRRHPVGSLLVWVTKTENATARGDGTLAPGSVQLLLVLRHSSCED